MRKLINNAVVAVILFGSFGLLSHALHAEQHWNAHVQTCANIQLSATYLAASAAAGGPAFQFAIHNGTDHAVSLVMPAPTSAHWYAREGSRWSWRASNGAGGSPVDAMNPQGKMFAFRAQPTAKREEKSGAGQGDPHIEKLVVAAHGFRNWELKPADNPVLNFKPSCMRCNHPTDREFRVVFAYAVLPGGEGPGGEETGMLSCGLRTVPVAVPASYANLAAGRSVESHLSLPGGSSSLVKTEPSNPQ